MFIESHLVMYEIEENGFFRLLHVNFQYQKKALCRKNRCRQAY